MQQKHSLTTVLYTETLSITCYFNQCEQIMAIKIINKILIKCYAIFSVIFSIKHFIMLLYACAYMYIRNKMEDMCVCVHYC